MKAVSSELRLLNPYTNSITRSSSEASRFRLSRVHGVHEGFRLLGFLLLFNAQISNHSLHPRRLPPRRPARNLLISLRVHAPILPLQA